VLVTLVGALLPPSPRFTVNLKGWVPNSAERYSGSTPKVPRNEPEARLLCATVSPAAMVCLWVPLTAGKTGSSLNSRFLVTR
jgi:hypothetical protein